MMSERLNLTVDDGIGEALAELAGSRNKMGDKVSELVRAAQQLSEVPAVSDTETLRLMVIGLSAELKQLRNSLGLDINHLYDDLGNLQYDMNERFENVAATLSKAGVIDNYEEGDNFA